MNAAADSVVLLHGMLGSPSAFDRMVEELARTGAPAARICALTLPGHGTCPEGTGDATFERALDTLSKRIDTLVAGRVGLVGYSAGGRLALALAARATVRASWVVAIGAHTGIEDAAERAGRAAWDRAMANLARTRGLEALADAWQALPIFASQRSLPEEVTREQRRVRTAHQREAIAWALETLGAGAMHPCSRALAERRIPVHLVAGSLDTKYVNGVRAVRAGLPLSRAHIVEGAGHNVLLEAPSAVARVVSSSFRLDHAQPIEGSP